jgi:hypothetical protein
MCPILLIDRKIWGYLNWRPLACLEEIRLKVKNREKKSYSKMESENRTDPAHRYLLLKSITYSKTQENKMNPQ